MSEPEGFTHHRESSHGVVTAALVLVCLAEGIPVHLALWATHPRLALVLSSLTSLALLDALREHLAVRNLLTHIVNDTLQLRVGTRWTAALPLKGAIVHTGQDMRTRRDRDVLRALAAPGEPSLVLEFAEPQPVRGRFGRIHRTRFVALAPDEPDRFIAALRHAGTVAADSPRAHR